MMTSGMHRRPFEGQHLVVEYLVNIWRIFSEYMSFGQRDSSDCKQHGTKLSTEGDEWVPLQPTSRKPCCRIWSIKKKYSMIEKNKFFSVLSEIPGAATGFPWGRLRQDSLSTFAELAIWAKKSGNCCTIFLIFLYFLPDFLRFAPSEPTPQTLYSPQVPHCIL